jgi:oligopeptide/dipeptide ABC transporter ATP-binding protein
VTEMTASDPLLRVSHLVQEFEVRNRSGLKGGVLQAVSDVSLDVRPGETLGVVGETGSGKSTLARSILQAPSPKSGEVVFQGTDLTRLSRAELRQVRPHLQMIFQDPFSSLDPRMRVSDLVAEPLILHKATVKGGRDRRVRELLDLVGLDPAQHGARHPRELSGGQCQRVAIARALALNPALIIADEAVSSLDVLIQAQVLNLFETLRRELGLAYLFIAHDLALVKQVSDRVAVMYLGKLCEVGPAAEIYRQPRHPYTHALLSAIPRPDPSAPRPMSGSAAAGEPPSPLDPPSGCRFRTRCPRAQERCAREEPPMRPIAATGHEVACHYPLVPGEPAATTPMVNEGAGQ